MSFKGQINFGYPLTSNNIITTIPDEAVMPLSIGSSLQGNTLGVTFGDLKSQIGGGINVYDAYGNPPLQVQNIEFAGQGWSVSAANLPAGYGASIALNLKTINGISILGGGDITAGLPSFIEYDEATKTFWNNGSGNQTENTSFGALALTLNSSGNLNTAYGYATLFRNANGTNNTAIGSNVLDANISGSFNTGIGSYALQRTVGYQNTGVGARALRYNTTGQSNVGIGFGTLGNNTTGSNNTVIGDGAMRDSTVSSLNTAVGFSALERGTGNGNTAIGYSAAQFNEGSGNIAIGNSALQPGFSAASNNIAIGNDSFRNITTGENNIGIGKTVLQQCYTGSNNIAIGQNASPINYSGTIVIGHDAYATGNNQFVVGSSGTNAGAIATETITANRTWTVRINGANYKIPLLAI